jgi:hypothetical protein
MTIKKLKRRLIEWNACREAINWMNENDFKTCKDAWNACPRADWLIWIAIRINPSKKMLKKTMSIMNKIRKVIANEIIANIISANYDKVFTSVIFHHAAICAVRYVIHATDTNHFPIHIVLAADKVALAIAHTTELSSNKYKYAKIVKKHIKYEDLIMPYQPFHKEVIH